MNTEQGSSLTEVLVSLLLVTGSSLALLNQQWQTSQLFNQIHLRTQAVLELDNTTELLIAGFRTHSNDPRYRFKKTTNSNLIHLNVFWHLQNKEAACLQRELHLS